MVWSLRREHVPWSLPQPKPHSSGQARPAGQHGVRGWPQAGVEGGVLEIVAQLPDIDRIDRVADIKYGLQPSGRKSKSSATSENVSPDNSKLLFSSSLVRRRSVSFRLIGLLR